MTSFTLSRSFYIPTGATKIAHKGSDAVVYTYTNSKGEICATAFHGTRKAKPDWRFRFTSEDARNKQIGRFFDSRAAHIARKAEQRKKANQGHNLQVGHILSAMWGYDQTNVDYFQVTKIIGKTMVEIREIGAVSDATGWAMGTCTPKLDNFIGEPKRRKVSNSYVKVDRVRLASLWSGTPDRWTSYA